jgi:hypothetical protein
MRGAYSKRVKSVLPGLIHRLSSKIKLGTAIIPWSCPVPAFGDADQSSLATLGINPSNLEFVDTHGRELDDSCRRFHTLNSLGLRHWDEANVRHSRLIWEACRSYFDTNPYDGWFRQLDDLIRDANASYYVSESAARYRACHLDLIPFATANKWTQLARRQRWELLCSAGNTLGLLLREARIKVVVLNGALVVDHFQQLAGVRLSARSMPDWNLPRKSQSPVRGFAYTGKVSEFAGVKLKHRILALGFNHNIQSSFGVTLGVRKAIRGWIARNARNVLQ